jgi:hypothetical protein
MVGSANTKMNSSEVVCVDFRRPLESGKVEVAGSRRGNKAHLHPLQGEVHVDDHAARGELQNARPVRTGAIFNLEREQIVYRRDEAEGTAENDQSPKIVLDQTGGEQNRGEVDADPKVGERPCHQHADLVARRLLRKKERQRRTTIAYSS